MGYVTGKPYRYVIENFIILSRKPYRCVIEKFIIFNGIRSDIYILFYTSLI